MQSNSPEHTALDSYTLHGRGEILEKLNLMRKKKCLLTVQVPHEESGYATTILHVLRDKGLLVLDESENPAVNQKLLAAEKLVVNTTVDGIRSRFMLEQLTAATWQGQSVFAAPLPEALFWMQQRKYFRVPIPYSMFLTCRIPLQEGIQEFRVLDLSIGGLALHDKSLLIGEGFEDGHIFEACNLILPDHGDIRIGLEMRYKMPMSANTPHAGQRIGCAFHGLSVQGEILLQKFVYEAELQKR